MFILRCTLCLALVYTYIYLHDASAPGIDGVADEIRRVVAREPAERAVVWCAAHAASCARTARVDAALVRSAVRNSAASMTRHRGDGAVLTEPR